jgi:hypothetical protein
MHLETGNGRSTVQGQPAHPRLVDALLAVEPAVYSPLATHVCAQAAGWVYADRPGAVTAATMNRLGLEGVRCKEIALHNDVMFIASTAVLLQSACGRVAILCYRGTEPRNLTSWMADFDVNPKFVGMRASPGGQKALIHLGFYRNLEATWDEVSRALDHALAGRPVDEAHDDSLRPLEALFVTGHSLGAAMAALAGVRLAIGDGERERFRSKLRGVYTFGQPFVGNPTFAAICSEDPLLCRGVFRHVYRNDVVPHLPGRPYGRFAHFGREFRASGQPPWRERTRDSAQAPDIVMSMFVVPTLAYWAKQLASTRRLERLAYSWYDHLPHFYIEASTLPGH